MRILIYVMLDVWREAATAKRAMASSCNLGMVIWLLPSGVIQCEYSYDFFWHLQAYTNDLQAEGTRTTKTK